MRSKKIEQIKALITQALHPKTEIELARTSALTALKIIHKYKFDIVDPTANNNPNIESTYDDEMHNAYTTEPHNTADWIEVKNFKIKMALNSDICKSCDKPYFKSEIIAFVHNNGSTHYKCRQYWTTHQS